MVIEHVGALDGTSGRAVGASGKHQLLQGYAPLQFPHTKQNVGDHNGFHAPI